MASDRTHRPLRFGTLGAARITPNALTIPASQSPDVRVVAVAARDPGRARRFAEDYGIERVVGSYDDLVADPDIDAVYNPLPASERLRWTLAALDAGKHVLDEKPFALHGGEAEQMAAAAAERGLVCAEAFHYRYHPLWAEIGRTVESGAVGEVRRIEGSFATEIPADDPVRHDLALGGGALMDLGCYVVSWLRGLAGEPAAILSASAVEGSPGVDVELEGELEFSGGVTGRVHCSMAAGQPFSASLTVTGSDGTLHVRNPLAPHAGNELRLVRPGEDERRWQVEPGRTTYAHQLDAFVAAVRDGAPMATAGDDPVRQMRVVDALYEAAGLPVRGTSA